MNLKNTNEVSKIMKIYLDDERTPPVGWTLVGTPAEVIALLKTGKVTQLSLDHDLGGDDTIGTGYDVLLWIEEQVYLHNFKPPMMKIHSANSSARDKMQLAINSINKKSGMQEKKSINLKSIVNELHGLKNLRVFDFDETLVVTQSNIYVRHEDGAIDSLTPGEYAIYKPKTGDTFDYTDFQRMLVRPNPINKNINLLKNALKNPMNKVTILTARSLAFPIRYYLKKQYNLDVYTVALGDSNPQKKADWIENHIKKGYNDIFFIDDSPKNVKAVDRLKRKYPNITLKTMIVK